MKKFLIFAAILMGTALLILLSGFSLPTEVALVILILAVASDFYTTYKCLKMRGREGNPLVAFLFRKLGIGGTFGLWAGVWVCFIMFRWLGSTDGIQTAMAITYWLVPMNNLSVLRKLKRIKCAEGG